MDDEEIRNGGEGFGVWRTGRGGEGRGGENTWKLCLSCFCSKMSRRQTPHLPENTWKPPHLPLPLPLPLPARDISTTRAQQIATNNHAREINSKKYLQYHYSIFTYFRNK